MWTGDTVSVTGLAEPEEVRCILVTDGLLRVLNVNPALGRLFSQQDDSPAGADDAVVGDDLADHGTTLPMERQAQTFYASPPNGRDDVREAATAAGYGHRGGGDCSREARSQAKDITERALSPSSDPCKRAPVDHCGPEGRKGPCRR